LPSGLHDHRLFLAAGVSDGFGFGDNSKASLLTRGIVEIRRLGVACGAQAETFSGLSGLGDLTVTCFSKLSRNRGLGERLGQGEKLEEILANSVSVAEGYPTARAAFRLARKLAVSTPIIDEVYAVLYEGKPVGTPDAGAFWRVVADHGVSTLFTAPTAFRAIRQQDPEGRHIERYDLAGFRTLFLAGERCDPETLHWAEQKLGVPVIDHWWQTETGWPIAANCVGLGMLPVKPGSPTKPVPGYDVRVLDEAGQEVPPGRIGSLVIRLPLPPGCLPTLWNNDAGFERAYLSRYPGYYLTGDAGYADEDGYVHVMSRIDDIINVAGHRLSTGAMEEVLAAHPDVAECAVIGVADEIKGEVPVGFVVTKAGVGRDAAAIVGELVERVRTEIGPVAAFRTAAVVARLPKTRSGKILRGTMKRIAEGAAYTPPATIDDPAILEEIAGTLKGLGYPRPRGGS
jgi:propionyl-CoA synthetase